MGKHSMRNALWPVNADIYPDFPRQISEKIAMTARHEITFFESKAVLSDLVGSKESARLKKDFYAVTVGDFDEARQAVPLILHCYDGSQDYVVPEFWVAQTTVQGYLDDAELVGRYHRNENVGDVYAVFKRLGWFLKDTFYAFQHIRETRYELAANAEAEYEMTLEELFDEYVPPSALYPKVDNETHPLSDVMVEILEQQLGQAYRQDPSKSHLEVYLPHVLEDDLGL